MLLFEFWEHLPFSSVLNHSDDLSSDSSGPGFVSCSAQLVGFVTLDADEQLVDAREMDSFEEQNLVLLEELPSEDCSSLVLLLLLALHRKAGFTSRDVVMGLLNIGNLGELSSVSAEIFPSNFPFSTTELSLSLVSPQITS
jgi:hypothetical protein